MKFGFLGTTTNTTGGLTTTIDQSTDADSLKHAGLDNIPGSRDGVPLENLLGDEKVEMESDTPPGTV
jgi:hypothetical protein